MATAFLSSVFTFLSSVDGVPLIPILLIIEFAKKYVISEIFVFSFTPRNESDASGGITVDAAAPMQHTSRNVPASVNAEIENNPIKSMRRPPLAQFSIIKSGCLLQISLIQFS